MTSEIIRFLRRMHLFYFLPLIHLSLCILLHANLISPYLTMVLILADMPVSYVLVPLVWHHPDAFLFWFGTFGTLWWTFLSYLAQRTKSKHQGHRGGVQP